MRSESMSAALRRLQWKLGEQYGREVWAWMLQKYWVGPEDEVPVGMSNEVGRIAS